MEPIELIARAIFLESARIAFAGVDDAQFVEPKWDTIRPETRARYLRYARVAVESLRDHGYSVCPAVTIQLPAASNE